MRAWVRGCHRGKGLERSPRLLAGAPRAPGRDRQSSGLGEERWGGGGLQRDPGEGQRGSRMEACLGVWRAVEKGLEGLLRGKEGFRGHPGETWPVERLGRTRA